ncbi:MAG: RNA polymerase factor sigma-54 [Proteobacteria bacterium]|nr:RNA polymerase factor sigma-54 [Pseudomonadota bacterium]
MGIGIEQNLKLSQQLTMTPQLQQAIKVLQLSRLDLEQYIQTQMSENPALEEKDYGPEEPLAKIENNTERAILGDLKKEGIVDEKSTDQSVDWDILVRHKEAMSSVQQSVQQRVSSQASKHRVEAVHYEQVVAAKITLTEHLAGQLALWHLPRKTLAIAREIIGNLDHRGYFDEAVGAMAQRLGVEEKEVEEALHIVQQCDPQGIGARDLFECLSLQMKRWGRESQDLKKIIATQVKELERKNYPRIAKNLGLSLKRVDAAIALLLELEPTPARPFVRSPAQYISVDVIVMMLGGELRVVANEDGFPRLKVSPYYQNMSLRMQEKKEKHKDKIKKKDHSYLQERLSSAAWLIKSLHRRESTILKVSEVIVRRQKDFFLKGSHYLKPMILRDVAEEIEIHESTVSRVVTGKYIQTPRGIFELSYFFSASLPRSVEGSDSAIAGEAVRQMIKDIFNSEDPTKPLSDQKVVHLLGQKGIRVARRTVAKYREQLGILSSSRRRRFVS